MDKTGMQLLTVVEDDRLVGTLTREQVLRHARSAAGPGV
jgi:hypothetical protein